MLRKIGFGVLACIALCAPFGVAAQQETHWDKDMRTPGMKFDDRKRAAEAAAKAATSGKSEPEKQKAAACSQLKTAQNAAYAAYIRLVVDELPDARNGASPDEMTEKLKALYEKQVATAQDGDVAALRKTAALEIFAMQLKQSPLPEFTRRKLCLFASEPQPGFGVLDNVACAVASIDSAERELHKSKAQAALEKARSLVPADANAASTDKLLYDDVARGLAGCM